MARFKFSFWLDANKDDELLLMDEIDTLKGERAFTATIRNGIKLMIELRQGKTDLLFTLFPDIRAKVAGSGGGVGQADIDRLERLIMAQGKASPGPFIEQNTHPLEIKKSATAGKESSMNFLKSLMALQG